MILHNVAVLEEDFLPLGGSGQSNPVQDRGFLWFELLITAAYLRIASGLVERVLLSGRGGAVERVSLATEVEGAMAALEGIARAMVAGERGNDELARMILVRYSVQAAIDRAVSLAFELLGGMAFIQVTGGLVLARRGARSFLAPTPAVAVQHTPWRVPRRQPAGAGLTREVRIACRQPIPTLARFVRALTLSREVTHRYSTLNSVSDSL